MPELPEVESIRRGLKPGLLGRVIQRVEIFLPKTAPDRDIMAMLPQKTIKGVGRRGKLLLLHIEDGILLAFHLRMTGRLFLTPSGQPMGRHCRLRFDLDNKSALLFDDARTFGLCRALFLAERDKWPYLSSLGPEPLQTTSETLAGRFIGRNSAIKAVLLDQSIMAGVGNIYADEALFLAGLHPSAKARRITEEKLLELAQAIQTVLKAGIENNGASIRDYLDSNGRKGGFQNIMQVYGRKGLPCPRCGQALKSARVAGRGSTFCLTCQPPQ